MKVVIAGLYYPIAILRYFHKALVNMPEVSEVVTVGPTSGPRIPWGKEFFFDAHAFYPDFQTSKDPVEAGKQVDGLITMGQISDVDLWIDVDAGFYIDSEILNPYAIVATDSHCLKYDRQRTLATHFFNMHQVYAQPSDYILPYCYSKYDHYPEDVPQTHDVSVLGLRYANRALVAEGLRARGLRVLEKLGFIWDDYRRAMCSAPISFTWSSKQDAIARVWESLAMRRLLVCNRVPDLKHHFVEGEHYIGYSTHQECIEQILYYVDHPDEAQMIADAGYRAVQGETYGARLRQLFETVGLT